MKNGEQFYKAFRKERFMRLRANITKEKQQPITYQPRPAEAPKKIEEITPKHSALTQR